MASQLTPSIDSYLKNFVYASQGSLFEEKETVLEEVSIQDIKVRKYINEFWTAGQRQSASLHEISYRACFKAQLPRFFITLLTKTGDLVYDPFMGRGTTLIESALLNRKVIGNDINPLSKILTYPRLNIPSIEDIQNRLKQIPKPHNLEADIDLSMFYHKNTTSEIIALKNYLAEREAEEKEDNINKWIRMVATNRLTGHSPGFFSVYTLPPNQAVSPESQKRINTKRKQKPEYRDTHIRILSKTKSLLKTISQEQIRYINEIGETALLLTDDARRTDKIKNDTVNLTVTSPPFLDIVQYSKDNWLRCWFNSIDVDEVSKKITVVKDIEDWSNIMKGAFKELHRITKKGGWVAFEVGELRKGSIKLDEYVAPIGLNTGFDCKGIIINQQEFTKTSNIWGIDNNQIGTNTNRIVLFFKN